MERKRSDEEKLKKGKKKKRKTAMVKFETHDQKKKMSPWEAN